MRKIVLLSQSLLLARSVSIQEKLNSQTLLQLDTADNEAELLAEEAADFGVTVHELMEDILQDTQESQPAQEKLVKNSVGKELLQFHGSDSSKPCWTEYREQLVWEEIRWDEIQSCMVWVGKPKPFYPAHIGGCAGRRKYRKENPIKLDIYRRKMREARDNSHYYRPYDEAKCKQAGGHLSYITKVPIKRITDFMINDNEVPYPGEGGMKCDAGDGGHAADDGGAADPGWGDDNGGGGGDPGWTDDHGGFDNDDGGADTSGGPDDPPCKTTKPFDIEFWKYQNMMRTEPQAFIPFLQDYMTRFDDKIVTLSDGTRLMTHEGVGAPKALIEFLKTAKPVTPLKWSEPLAIAARQFQEDQGPTGQTGHTGPDGSTMSSRISAQMKWEVTIGENCMYFGRSPIEAVLALAMDDGIPSRGHRNNIFQSKFFYQGSATGGHSKFQDSTVIDFSGSNHPDMNYKAPTIEVPQTMAENDGVGYPSWHMPPMC